MSSSAEVRRCIAYSWSEKLEGQCAKIHSPDELCTFACPEKGKDTVLSMGRSVSKQAIGDRNSTICAL